MQFKIVCKLCDHNILQPLQKCEQNLILLYSAANMNEITNGTNNYAIGQWTVVSVWTH